MEPDKSKLIIDVSQSKYGGAGIVSSYLMKVIAAAAGTYAPGIQDRMFFDLQRRGTDVARVREWLGKNLDQLNYLGYAFLCRNVSEPTPDLCEWVTLGKGHRGVILPAAGSILHPEMKVDDSSYSVALCCRPEANNELTMIDPWPGTTPRQIPPPATLEAAHRARQYLAIAIFWRGYS